MKAAIMQPYFFPYIGYFQLIAAVDLFIVYDNIKYTKKGWINRNRMLQNGKDVVFSLPLKRDSDTLDVCDRVVAADFDRRQAAEPDRRRLPTRTVFRAGLPADRGHRAAMRNATCSAFCITRSSEPASISDRH